MNAPKIGDTVTNWDGKVGTVIKVVYWADNSIDAVVDTAEGQKTWEVVAPWGDAC